MIRLLPLMLITLLLLLFPYKSAGIAGGEARSSHYICSLDLALRANDASADTDGVSTRDKVANLAGRATYHANLIGRGLANCKNQQGFEVALPAVMVISMNAEQEFPLQSLRASILPISINRDVNMIFDQYIPHVELRNTPATGTYSSADRTLVVKGTTNDVLIQININVPAEFTSKFKVARVDLKLDNQADRPTGRRK